MKNFRQYFVFCSSMKKNNKVRKSFVKSLNDEKKAIYGMSPPATKKKKKKKGNVDEFDEALIKILANTQNMQMDDEECFGRCIDATLRCFSPKQKALAKL